MPARKCRYRGRSDLTLTGSERPDDCRHLRNRQAVTATVTNPTEELFPVRSYRFTFSFPNSTITESDTYIGSRVISGMGPGATAPRRPQ